MEKNIGRRFVYDVWNMSLWHTVLRKRERKALESVVDIHWILLDMNVHRKISSVIYDSLVLKSPQ